MATTSVRHGGPALKSPLDDPTSPLSRATAKQPLLLGVFLNLQDIHISSHPTTNSWTFPYNLSIVQEAERQGFELAFSRAQWLPKGGYDGAASQDAFISLGAMAAATKSIILISTLHILYGPLHPLHIAKWGATFDHVSQGRWGLNIATGHRLIEHDPLPIARLGNEALQGIAKRLGRYPGRIELADYSIVQGKTLQERHTCIGMPITHL